MITHFDENLPVKVLGSLTIDEEKEIDNCGLLLINQKYHGFQINYRQ